MIHTLVTMCDVKIAAGISYAKWYSYLSKQRMLLLIREGLDKKSPKVEVVRLQRLNLY